MQSIYGCNFQICFLDDARGGKGWKPKLVRRGPKTTDEGWHGLRRPGEDERASVWTKEHRYGRKKFGESDRGR